MNAPEEASLVARLAVRHGLSDAAVKEVLRALCAGGGTMAQFSHPEFGGMAQWSHDDGRRHVQRPLEGQA